MYNLSRDQNNLTIWGPNTEADYCFTGKKQRIKKQSTLNDWVMPTVPLLAQPLAYNLGDLLSSTNETWKITVPWWIHVSTVSCACDEYCCQRVWNVTGDTQCMPRINWAVWKYNVGSILRHIFTTIISISGSYSRTDRVRGYVVDQTADFGIGVERDGTAKWLLIWVCCLEVAKFTTGLVSPLSVCMERQGNIVPM